MTDARPALILLAALALAGCGAKGLTAQQTCQTGVYRLADGRVLDIAPSEGPDLRWRLNDGRSGRLSAKDHWSSTLGWTGKPDGVTVALGACGARTAAFADKGAAPVSGERLTFVSRDMTFVSGGLTLHGRLVMPPGDGPAPVAVEVHGSEKDAATVFNPEQRMMPAQGVGVFVYDKRGTGQSQGKYTQDFTVLAADAAAAARAARAAAGVRLGRLGFEGGSQEGWVSPLAATPTPVDFVIVGYGLAGSPAEENTDQTVVELARKGYGPADLKAAAEVSDAVNAVAASRFQIGYARLDALRAKYGDKPWFKQIHGQYNDQILKYPSWLIKLAAPLFDVGTPFNYDAVPVLRRVPVPMLWILADEDTQAPNQTTRARLRGLIDEGRPITVMAFPATDHGITEYVTAPDGTRLRTRYADGYRRAVLDWVKTGKLTPPYGKGVVIATPKAPPATVAALSR